MVDAALIQYKGYAADHSNSVLTGLTVEQQVADHLYEVSLHAKHWVVYFITRRFDFAETTAMLAGRCTAIQQGKLT